MALRSFSRRSRYLMITLWKTIVQPKLDYCSQLWSPSDQGSIAKLESIMRSFTSKISGYQDVDYWDRLSQLNLLSQERRRERYIILFLWKISQGLVDGYKVPFKFHPRRGRLIYISLTRNSAPTCVKKAVESSLKVKGARLFNSLPVSLRNMNGDNVDNFKFHLDIFLSQIPDQPTIPGRIRAAATNSLVDQIILLGH